MPFHGEDHDGVDVEQQADDVQPRTGKPVVGCGFPGAGIDSKGLYKGWDRESEKTGQHDYADHLTRSDVFGKAFH